MEQKSQPWLGRYLAIGVIWGCSFLFIAWANQFLTAAGVGFWRMFFGALPMAILMLVGGHRLPREGSTWFKIGLTALGMNAIPSVLFAYAEQHVTSAFAGIINAATPIATLLMILLIFREEKPSARVLVGLGVGLIGVLVVLKVWSGVGDNDPGAVIALIVAILLYGVFGPFAKRYVSPLKLEPSVQITMQVGMAGVMLAPFYLAGPLVTATPTIEGVVGILALGILGSGFAYIWYYQILNTAGSAIANAVTYLSPVVSVIAGAALLSESVSWNEILGGIVVILGALISGGQVGRRRSR